MNIPSEYTITSKPLVERKKERKKEKKKERKRERKKEKEKIQVRQT